MCSLFKCKTGDVRVECLPHKVVLFRVPGLAEGWKGLANELHFRSAHLRYEFTLNVALKEQWRTKVTGCIVSLLLSQSNVIEKGSITKRNVHKELFCLW